MTNTKENAINRDISIHFSDNGQASHAVNSAASVIQSFVNELDGCVCSDDYKRRGQRDPACTPYKLEPEVNAAKKWLRFYNNVLLRYAKLTNAELMDVKRRLYMSHLLNPDAMDNDYFTTVLAPENEALKHEIAIRKLRGEAFTSDPEATRA